MRPIHPSTMALSEQIAYLVVIATVTAWIAWVWTHEEIFKDIQDYLKKQHKKHNAKMKEFYYAGNYRPMIREWFIQKVCFGLTCQTCVAHYPNLLFVWSCHIRLIYPDGYGFVFAWMFTTFTTDSVVWLLGCMRKGQKLEDSAVKAMEAGGILLERKVAKDETSDISPIPETGPVRPNTPTRVLVDGDGAGVGRQANGPTIR